MHIIQIDGKGYTGPDKFEELTEEQFIAVVTIMQQSEKNPSAKWALLPLLYRIPVKEMERLNPVQRVELLAVTDFLYDETKLPYKELIHKIPVQIGKALTLYTLYGPGDGLKNLIFGEFMAAELKLEAFNKGASPEALDEFCGILYRISDRQSKKKTDKRIPFSEALIGRYAEKVVNLPVPIKTAIMLQYHGAKKLFPRLFKYVFPQKEEDEEVEKGQKKSGQSSSMTWLNAAISMANNDVTKISLVEATPLHLTLKVLNDTIKENQELQRKLAAHRK